MKETEVRDQAETADQDQMQVDEPVKETQKTAPIKTTAEPLIQSPSIVPASSSTMDEGRDEVSERDGVEEREEHPSKLKSTPRKSNTKSSSGAIQQNRRANGSFDNSGSPSSGYPYAKGGRYPPHQGRPYAPHPPPPYGYEGPFRPPPPPPHYSHMPPLHLGQGGGYPYHPPHPSYHYGYNHGAPMPYPPPPHPMHPSYSHENTSHSSSKKTGVHNSKLPRKKRVMDHQFPHEDPTIGGHRREFSIASTASTLSEGGMSLCSYEKGKEDNPLTRASPKRRRGHDSNPISVNTSFEDHQRTSSDSAARFQKLSVCDSISHRDDQTSIFLTLSTSPIHEDVDATPVSKNQKKSSALNKMILQAASTDSFVQRTRSLDSAAEIEKMIDRNADTPTPPLQGNGGQTNVLTDEHLLNRHLRGQTFTPLPGTSPSNNNISHTTSFSAIQPQLSWSIAGDAPSLGDLAEWEEKRPASTTSQNSHNSRAMALSPHSFAMWKDDDPNNQHRTQSRDDSLRLSMLSPHSEIEGGGEQGGATTPLPFFLHEERENAVHRTFSAASDKESGHFGSSHQYHRVPENVDSIFVHKSGSKKSSRWSHPHVGRSDSGGNSGMRGMPPTPGDYHEYSRSPHGRGGGPHESYYHHPYMGPPSHMPDRVRNLRGRAPPHHAPLPLSMPPTVSSHHSLTSPMGAPNKMWAVPPGHHMPPHMELNPSKRKCVPLKPPIPSKFQGDIEKVKGAQVPEFTALVNYPAHMSQKQSVNLPDNMRCCVMCGQACPCSNANKSKKQCNSKKQGELDKSGGFAIIPTQNKGLCTLCDVNVWIVCSSGLEIKWCKGCKNFRPWAAFGDKGLATKCLRCRDRQREKYALQKEEKEKARVHSRSNKMAKV